MKTQYILFELKGSDILVDVEIERLLHQWKIQRVFTLKCEDSSLPEDERKYVSFDGKCVLTVGAELLSGDWSEVCQRAQKERSSCS
jgi:hypothetical protein